MKIRKFIDGYFCDEKGRIYRNGKELKASKRDNKSEYMRVTINANGKRRLFYVHRIIAKSFISNPQDKPCVNHKDGNKMNNNVSNLEWVTYSENMIHAVSIGLYSKKEKAVRNRRPIIKLSIDEIPIKEYKSLTDAAKDNNCGITILRYCANGGYFCGGKNNKWVKMEQFMGFKWKYKAIKSSHRKMFNL